MRVKLLYQIAICVVLLVWCSSCQRYQPLHVDLAGHLAQWQERGLESELEVRPMIPIGEMAPERKMDDGLDLLEAEWMALMNAPSLRMARAQAGIVLANAEHAGILDDPEIGVDLIRILDPVAFPNRWHGSVGLPIPLFGQLSREKARAWAAYSLSEKELAFAEWEILLKIRELWTQWSGLERRTSLTYEYLDQLEELLITVKQLSFLGELDSTDARIFEIEQAGHWQELIDLENQTAQVKYRIFQLLGFHPDDVISLHPCIPLWEEPKIPEVGEMPISLNHPRLASLQAQMELADQNLRLELRKQYGGLSLAPGYGEEESLPQTSLGVSFVLPLWNRNKQAVAEAFAARDLAQVQLETAYEIMVSELVACRADILAAQERRAVLAQEVLPLTAQQLKSVKQLVDVGEIDVLLIQDAMERSLEAGIESLNALVLESLARNRLGGMLIPATWTNQEHQGEAP